jgi:GR25 family glycosyltransferase involved in LPS biosynthesis
MDFEFPIYCINLEERKDRKENIKKEFNKLNIDLSIVKFLKFNRDIRGGRYGCYDSHVKVWNDFYQNSTSNYCLIFEDDFVSNNNCKGIIEKGNKFMKKNYNDVDFLFLHNYFVELPSNLNNDNFIRGLGFNTHSYFISKNYINNLINKYNFNWLNPDGLDIDLSINFNNSNILNSEKCFYSKQEAFKQLEIWRSKSDNISIFLDNIWRLPISTEFVKMKLKILLSFMKENEVKDLFINEITIINNKNE